MPERKKRTERKPARAPRRRSRATDADAEVNPPGEPHTVPIAAGTQQASQTPGRKGTMRRRPWRRNEPSGDASSEASPNPVDQAIPEHGSEAGAPNGDDDDEDDHDFPRPGRPPSPGRTGD